MQTNERYTHGHHESVVGAHAWRTVENSAAYLIPHLAPGLSVLDIGSGPGTITVDLAQRVAPGRVTGIDAVDSVVDQARAHAAANGVTNVEFATGDAYHLEFPDDTFDIVHAHQVLQHLGDPIAVLTEMRRVVKPGGVVAVREVDYGGSIWSPASEGLTDWMRILQAVQRWNSGDPDAGRALKSWAMRAGFTQVTSTASIWCFSSDEDRAWWGNSWAQRALESNYAVHSLEAGIATREDLQRVSDAWTSWVHDPEGWYAMPHGEIIAVK